MRKERNYIGGQWRDADSGQAMRNVNPATGEIIALYPRSSSVDIQTAISSARGALREWRNTPASERGAYLYDVARYLKQNIQDFGVGVCREMGKTLNESIGDIQESIDMAEFCAGEGRRNLGMVTSSEHRNRLVLAYREPLGVAGAITPWNYPMAMPAWKIMGVLITGYGEYCGA